MATEVTSWLSTGISGTYQAFLDSLPFWAQNFINLFLIVLVIVIYTILIWHFYRFIAKKNFFDINLRKYNRSEHPVWSKSIAAFFYLIEYLIVLPVLVFLWFSVFTLFLMFLTIELPLATILLISATIIAAIRMTAYYKEDLSKDIAKLLPFTLLGIFITQFGNFDFATLLGHIKNLPDFFSQIGIYFLFILVIEFVLRLIDIIFRVSGIEEEPVEEVEEKSE
ncbi:hypothetical protein HOD29_00045 [archaeon]|nr:hypothetical protein [archaeon]